MICGTHHLVQLSQNDPKDKNLDLNSVSTVMPMGSTVPFTLYEDLKRNLKNLSAIYNMYGMSEVTGLISSSLDVKNLGVVAERAVVKIVSIKSGQLCGINEVSNMNNIEVVFKKVLTYCNTLSILKCLFGI